MEWVCRGCVLQVSLKGLLGYSKLHVGFCVFLYNDLAAKNRRIETHCKQVFKGENNYENKFSKHIYIFLLKSKNTIQTTSHSPKILIHLMMLSH
jgi:hypothetical protein